MTSEKEGIGEIGTMIAFERFTDRARKVMALANQEAQRFNHEYIGTEHILLGLAKEGCGLGWKALVIHGFTIEKIRAEVEKQVGIGPDVITMGRIPHNEQARLAIDGAFAEARELNDNYVGTEHVLLGLLRVENSIAHSVLKGLGADVAQIRQWSVDLLTPEPEKPRPLGSIPMSDMDIRTYLTGQALANPAICRGTDAGDDEARVAVLVHRTIKMLARLQEDSA